MRRVLAHAAMVVWECAAPEGVRNPVEQPDHFSTSNSNSITLPRTT